MVCPYEVCLDTDQKINKIVQKIFSPTCTPKCQLQTRHPIKKLHQLTHPTSGILITLPPIHTQILSKTTSSTPKPPLPTLLPHPKFNFPTFPQPNHLAKPYHFHTSPQHFSTAQFRIDPSPTIPHPGIVYKNAPTKISPTPQISLTHQAFPYLNTSRHPDPPRPPTSQAPHDHLPSKSLPNTIKKPPTGGTFKLYNIIIVLSDTPLYINIYK